MAGREKLSDRYNHALEDVISDQRVSAATATKKAHILVNEDNCCA